MTEYIRVRKDEYEELKLAKLELLQYKTRDTQIEEARELLLGKLLKQKQDLKEWLEEEIITIEDKPTYTFIGSLEKEIRVNDEIVNELQEVLERLVGEK